MNKDNPDNLVIKNVDDLLDDSKDPFLNQNDFHRRTSQQILTHNIAADRKTSEQIDLGIDCLIAKHNPLAHKGKQEKDRLK